MADDQNKPEGGDDPWAGIDADSSEAAESAFDFPSFDPLDGEAKAATPAHGVEPEATEMTLFEADAPGEATAKEASIAPSFDALSLGANDGVFTDDSGWSADEPPLAVFPPADSAEPHGGIAAPDQDDADALAHLHDDSELVPFAPSSTPSDETNGGVAAFDADAIAFDAGAIEGDSPADASLIGKSSVEVGTGHSGIVSFDEWADAPPAEAARADEGSAFGDGGEGFDFDGETDPIETGEALEDDFAAGMTSAVADAIPVVAGASVAAKPAASVAAKPAAVKRVVRRSGGSSGILPVIGVLLGGVLSIPIVFALLFWVFRKDPLNIAPKIPQSLSFLLPAEFQIAGGRPAAVPGLPGTGPLVASRSLDEPSDEPPAPPAPPATDDSVVGETEEAPAEGGGLPGTDEPKPSATAVVPPPLDTAPFDESVAAALAATDRLLGAEDDAPDRKAMLKAWYLSLAKVGEEAAGIEKTAVESGQPFDPASDSVARVVGRVLADEKAAGQFDKVARMWIRSKNRTSDGIMLPATLEATKQVGPWWFSKVRIGEGADATEVAVVSRGRPAGSEGDRVVVIGLVFDPGTIWAAACKRFEPIAEEDAPADAQDDGVGEPAAAKPAADGLFPLE